MTGKMGTMSREVMVLNIELVVQELKALKVEHNSMLSRLQEQTQDPIAEEKKHILFESLKKVESGLEETMILKTLADNLETIEAQKEKLRTQNKRILGENEWLRDEFTVMQQKFEASEGTVVKFEEELKQLRFMESLQKHDHVSESEEGKQDTSSDPLADLFPDQDTERTLPATPQTEYEEYKNSNEAVSHLRALHKLAIQYAKKGQYQVAVPLCKQALEDLEKACGHEHPDVATMLNILAIIYRNQSKYKDAAKLLNETLAIREKALGENHPSVPATLNNLAVLYGMQRKYKEAESFCKRALEIMENNLGNDHPDVVRQQDNWHYLQKAQGHNQLLKSFPKNKFTLLQCRSIRVGSYSVVPRDSVLLSPLGVKMAVPSLEDSNVNVALNIQFEEIIRVLVHDGKRIPVLFLYISSSAGAEIRKVLKMESKDAHYFDPMSKDEKHKSITLFLEKITDASRGALKNIFSSDDKGEHKLEELTFKEANDILMRASPQEASQVSTKPKTQERKGKSVVKKKQSKIPTV